MQALLRPFRQWLGMRSLRTQLQLTAAGLCILGLLVVFPLSLHRLEQQIESESTEWSVALASMAAHTSNTLLDPNDRASLEAALQEFVALPGVMQIDVMGPGGQPVMRVLRQPTGATVTIRPHHETPRPAPETWLQSDRQRHRVTAMISLLDHDRGAHRHGFDRATLLNEGWVSVEVGYDERLVLAREQWLEAAIGSLVLLLLGLGLFNLFLRRTVRPIRALAQFASTLVQHPGEQLMLRWGSREVRELGRTLNWSSQELARHSSETQQRISRLHAILDTAADAIIGINAQGFIANANPAAERMFGHTVQALLQRPISDILPGVDADRLRQTMADGMLIHSTQSRIGRIETEAQRHGETSFPVEMLLGEIQGDPDIRYTCIVRDLTDMKLAEEYLTLYGRVLDCSPSGVSVSDARRYPQPIVHINPAFTRITGYAPHEILGRDASILNGALTDRDDLDLLERTIKRGGELKVTLHNYRKDGSLFHNKLSVSPVRDAQGEITHYINVIEDVSGQVEVKQRLIERTARLNATFDLSPDGFAVFDAQGELITSNPALRQMVGDVPAWLPMGRFDQWVRDLCEEPDRYPPVSTAPDDGAKQTLVLARPSRKVLERDVRRHLGGSGETFVYFRDVTHQFEVDRMKSEFLATAAHELRTPLASILGFTELMLHRKYTEEKQKDLLQTVHRQGSLLNNLIQELLDLSRIEARQGKDFHIVPTPLAPIVEAAVQGVAHQELGRQVTLDALPEVTVMADASKIEQALNNLLSNAIKYSPAGGDVQLRVDQTERDGHACARIEVQDRGIGMTPSQLARAFERFYRADTSGNIPGTGLGLNIVKEIAEIHGGWVELSSTPGEGTTASLWLRLASVPAGAAEAAPA